jgi:Uma2 family endonuclease
MSVMAPPYEDVPVRDDGFTVEDLDEMPDDGRRYELIDGLLVVSPTPRWEHQRASIKLGGVLDAACPDAFAVLDPIDVRGGPRTSVQPDLSVVRDSDLVPDQRYLSVPVLAVEIGSPTTARVDRKLKRDVYAGLGIASYWIVDLDEPSITVLRLIGDCYVEQATVRGDETLTVTEPFPVTLRPSQLVRRGARPER